MVFDENGELGQGAIKVSLLRIFHRKAIARERVLRVLGQDVVQCGNAIHVREIPAIETTTPAAHGPGFASSITMSSPENFRLRGSRGLSSFHGLAVGLTWWILGMILALGYFFFLFRMFRGKVRLEDGGY